VQPRFNLIHRNAVDVLAWSAAHAAGAIVYSPMASGLLSGSFTAARAATLDEDDWRRRHPDFTGDALVRNLALAEALGPIASRHGVTVAAVAVAWTLAFPGVTGAIVGVRRAGQLDAWLPAARLALDDSDLTRIADAIEHTGAGSGPVLPAHAA
jgi:aryl-alcohol dehydrogenase-like predicted oxidoreductase